MDIKSFIKSKRRFILYSLTGCINTLVDFMVFMAVYELTGIPEEYCQAIGYSAGIISSFLLNSHLAFKDNNGGPLYLQIFRFLFVSAISLLIGTYGMKTLVGIHLGAYISKAIITVIVALVNYFGYKILVFRVKD